MTYSYSIVSRGLRPDMHLMEIGVSVCFFFFFSVSTVYHVPLYFLRTRKLRCGRIVS